MKANKKVVKPTLKKCDISVVNHLDIPIRAKIEDKGNKLLIHIHKEVL